MADIESDAGALDEPAGKLAGANRKPIVLAYATPQRVVHNLAAVWAMACAVMFFGVLVSADTWRVPEPVAFAAKIAMPIAAMILGRKGMARTAPQPGRLIAWAAFWIGCISFLSITTIAVLMPNHGYPKGRAMRIKCACNLRDIGRALELYTNDNSGLLPPDLGVLIATVDLQAATLVCPASGDNPATGPTTRAIARNAIALKGHCSYVYLGAGLNQKALTGNHVIAYENTVKHHENDGMNVLYGGGHTEWLQTKDVAYLLSELKAGHNPPRPPAPTSRP